MSLKAYTEEWNKVLNKLLHQNNFPQWNTNKQHWEDTELNPMEVYVETLEGEKLPIKWVWKEILGPFGIDQRDLKSNQIEHFFTDIGFNTDSYGRK